MILLHVETIYQWLIAQLTQAYQKGYSVKSGLSSELLASYREWLLLINSRKTLNFYVFGTFITQWTVSDSPNFLPGVSKRHTRKGKLFSFHIRTVLLALLEKGLVIPYAGKSIDNGQVVYRTGAKPQALTDGTFIDTQSYPVWPSLQTKDLDRLAGFLPVCTFNRSLF
jgi:hypothetical protein